MVNLTLSLDADLLQKAREAALRDRTTVNAVVREFLTRYADARARRLQALDAFDSVAQRNASRTEEPWSREDLHQR